MIQDKVSIIDSLLVVTDDRHGTNPDLMINNYYFLYRKLKCLIKMKFDRTFTPNARTPMYVNFVLIILLGQC